MAQTGFTPISIYYSSTASNVPTAGNLVAGELAINTADGRLFYKDSSGVVQVIGTKGGVGSSTTTQVLYNSSGLVVGSANMTFNGTTLTLANDASISGLTVGKGGGAASQNTALGISAIGSSNTGNYSVGIGYQTLYSNTSGYSNTAVGLSAMYANTTGANNSAFGLQGLQANTTGTNNTTVGFQSLYSNTTASNNTAVGYQAGYSNTTGATLDAFGYQALYSNTTGTNNVGFGRSVLYTNTVGAGNTGMGAATLYYNTGSSNTAIGQQALYSNTTASNNTAVGFQAGYSGTTAANNSLFGKNAGYALTTGSQNTLIGGDNGTTGAAGGQITTGSKNTIIGAYSGNQLGLDIRTASNYIVLSDGDGNPRAYIDNNGSFFSTTGTANNNVQLSTVNGYAICAINHPTGTGTGTAFNQYIYAGTEIGSVKQTGTTAVLYNTTSDYRLKNDVAPIQNALSTVDALNPVSFTWIDGRKDDGFLAHELQAIIPNCVTGEKDAVNEDGTPKYQQMDNSGVIPFLVKAIQELNEKVTALEAGAKA